MLDTQGRIAIRKDLLERASLELYEEVDMFYTADEKCLLLRKKGLNYIPNTYFIQTVKIYKGRIFMPAEVRKAFPEASYLPTEREGIIYIHIFYEEKKEE